MEKHPVQTKLSVTFLREGKRFIAYSPALDLSTSGKSFEEVKKRFEEIVEIFFEEVAKKGTLEEVLQNLGWERQDKRWTPPAIIAHESQMIRLPAFV
jgi:predicted RNase H-like HicB family nuclease